MWRTVERCTDEKYWGEDNIAKIAQFLECSKKSVKELLGGSFITELRLGPLRYAVIRLPMMDLPRPLEDLTLAEFLELSKSEPELQQLSESVAALLEDQKKKRYSIPEST